MSEATFYLFKALLDLFTVFVVLNFLFRLLKVDYFNPIVQGIIKAVDYPSQFLRTFLKPIYRLDFFFTDNCHPNSIYCFLPSCCSRFNRLRSRKNYNLVSLLRSNPKLKNLILVNARRNSS